MAQGALVKAVNPFKMPSADLHHGRDPAHHGGYRSEPRDRPVDVGGLLARGRDDRARAPIARSISTRSSPGAGAMRSTTSSSTRPGFPARLVRSQDRSGWSGARRWWMRKRSIAPPRAADDVMILNQGAMCPAAPVRGRVCEDVDASCAWAAPSHRRAAAASGDARPLEMDGRSGRDDGHDGRRVRRWAGPTVAWSSVPRSRSISTRSTRPPSSCGWICLTTW